MSQTSVRRILTVFWIAGASAAIYVYVAHREWLEDLLNRTATTSFAGGAAIYLILGCLRGFTMIPVTSLVLLGLVFFRPWPLFYLTLAGILVSSTSVYYFAEALHLDDLLRRRHAHQFDRVKRLLERYGTAIIIAWSFFPLVPTDLICYLAGVARIRLTKVLASVAIGEGAICAIYIFLGDSVLRSLGLR